MQQIVVLETPIEPYWFTGSSGGLDAGLFSRGGLGSAPHQYFKLSLTCPCSSVVLGTWAVMAYIPPAPAFVTQGCSTITLLVVLGLWPILLGHIIMIILVLIYSLPCLSGLAGADWLTLIHCYDFDHPWAQLPVLAPTWGLLALANLYLAF